MKKQLIRGIITENPTFVLFLGLCPTLAMTNSLINAVGMGVSVLIVLMITNVLISLVRNQIPNDIRIPVYITIIATAVTILQYFLNTFFISIYDSLGIYLPLIVVNCIVLGRAEAFASQNKPKDAFIDGLATGLGFLGGLMVLGFARELIGTGSLNVYFTTLTIIPTEFAPNIFVQSSGAFLMFGLIAWVMNTIKMKKKEVK